MKIERRTPVNPYREQIKGQLRGHIPVARVAKYTVLTVAGFLLFRAGQAHALAERGYEALGGEVFALFLPVFCWMVPRIIRDILDLREGEGPWRTK